MNSQTTRYGIVAFMILVFVNTSFADRRSYVWTYGYHTMSAGEAEVEHYQTLETLELDSLENSVSSNFKYEIEIGMNDRFDVAIYQLFSQPATGPFQYKGYQIRMRYRLGEKNRWIMDPVLYFEYKGLPDFSQHGLEGKLILAKDLGPWNFAVNPVMEIEIEAGESEFELELFGGVSYTLNDLVRLGLEYQGKGSGHYLGPVISHGGEHLWVALGSGFAVTPVSEGRPEFLLRLILGVGL